MLQYILNVTLSPPALATGFAIITGLLITGAFHEDGPADIFDGLGGGWAVIDKVNIMKDSRLATYDTSALMMIVGIKWITLTSLVHLYLYLPEQH